MKNKTPKQRKVGKQLSAESMQEVKGGLTLTRLSAYQLGSIFAGPNDKTVVDSPALASLTSIRTALTYR